MPVFTGLFGGPLPYTAQDCQTLREPVKRCLQAESKPSAIGSVQNALHDENGHPRKRHRPCPACDETRDVASSFNDVWCTNCGWRGLLSDMHQPSPYPNMLTQLRKG